MKTLVFLALACFLIIMNNIPAIGQSEKESKSGYFEDDLLEKLAGYWTARGKIAEENVSYDITADWTLEHRFLQIDISDVKEEPEYSARIMIGYDKTAGKYIAHWLDNMGGTYSKTLGTGTKKGDTLELAFDYPAGLLINRFIYSRESDTWRFHAVVKNEANGWDTFGNINLKKNRLNITDGLYIVNRKSVNALDIRELHDRETVINVNKQVLEESPQGMYLLVIDTSDYVRLELDSQPVTEPQTADRKLLLLSLNKTQAQKLAEFTAKNIMRRAVIVIDGEAYSVHKIRTAITGGKIQISRCTDNACETLFIKLKDNFKKE